MYLKIIQDYFMEIFDGFISGVASELKIPFHKSKDGSYTASIEFENGRSQEINVILRRDEAGDRVINYSSKIGDVNEDTEKDIFRTCLQLNRKFDYGALALEGDTLVMYNSIMLSDIEPRRFIKSLFYIAAKADEIEEILMNSDSN